MSDPIEHRLRDSLSRHAGAVTPTADGWTAIRERAERADRLFARRRRTFRLAASGALAALVAVAVPLTLDRIRSDDDGITFAPPTIAETTTPTPTVPPTPTTTSTDPSPVPSASPVPTGEPPAPAAPQGWTLVDDGGALTPGPFVYVEDAAALGSRMAAVGYYSPSPDANQAAVWLADDGQGWRLVDDPAVFGGEPDTYTQALGVAATDRGFVAVGTTYSGDEIDLPLVWTSPDGTAWERAGLPGDGRATAVTEVADGRLVAVGAITGFIPAIWSSADGVTWDLTVLDLLGEEGTLDHVVVVGQRVVALGRSSVVVSEDGGATWTQIALADAGLPGALEDVAVLGDGSLAGVVVTESGLLAHTSADGTSWEPTSQFPPAPQDSFQRVQQVVTLADGTLVAAGLAFDMTAAREVPAVWTSQDGGVRWVRDDEAAVALGDGTSVTALAVTDDTLVALGSGAGGTGEGARAWTRRLP